MSKASDIESEPVTTETLAVDARSRLRFEHGVRSILEDSKGNFWFGSWQEGVCRFDGEQLTYFTKADGLDRNQVRKVFEDRKGTIWFDRSPEEFLDAMEGEQARRSPNWIGYPEPRDALVKSGWKAIQDSEDPAIVAARELVILMRKNEQLGEELDAKEEALRAEMGHALFACYGTNVSPDGTMTTGDFNCDCVSDVSDFNTWGAKSEAHRSPG